MFKNDNEHDFNLVMDMHTKLNDLGMRIRQMDELILDVQQQGYSAEIFESVKLLKEYEAKVVITSKLRYISLFKEILNENKRKLFRNTCFSKWLDISFYDNEPHFIDYILQKQVFVDDAHYDMPLDYLIQEESRLKQEDDEMCRLEEHKMMEALFLKTLQEEVQRRDAKQKMLKYDEDKNKRRHELMNSDHWKHSVLKITNGKRTQRSSAFSAYYWGNTFAMAEKDRPLNSLNDQDMNIFLKAVTAWVEDLARYNLETDRVYLSDTFDIFLGRQGPLRCRFPWCKDVSTEDPMMLIGPWLVVTLSSFSFKTRSRRGILMARCTKSLGAMLKRFLCLLMKRTNTGVLHTCTLGQDW
nr:phospholipase-like protein [Tanacetum cinerariifolium]